MDMTSDLRAFLHSAQASAEVTARRVERLLQGAGVPALSASALLRDALADAHHLVAYIEKARAEVERGY